jgi:regulator of chromosome condensation
MKEVEVRRQAAEQRWREKRAREATKRAREALKRAAKAAAVGDDENNEEDPKAPQTSEKPPPMDEYVPEPVPIIFPPPPTSSNSSNDPTLPPWNDSAYTTPPVDPIIHVSAGTRHNLAVTKMGYVYAWGFSTQCALGLGKDVEFAKTPQRVKSKGMEGWHVEMAAAGGQHCLVLARRLVG